MKENMKKMWREHKLMLVITSCVILLQTVVGVILWDRLPEQIATHFGLNGQPDGYSSRAFTVFGMPLVLLALHWVCPFISWLCAGMTIGYALNAVRNIGVVVCVFLGILFMVIGNYLPKCLPSYTVGIKLPWTLHDEGNWRYTHRIGGFCFTAAGLIVLVSAFFGGTWLPLAALALAVIVPTVASFLYYKKHS